MASNRDAPTAAQVAEAWRSVKDHWFTRRYAHAYPTPWEVVHDWGGDVIADATMKVVKRFANKADADELSARLENEARGAAVLRLFITQTGSTKP